MHGFSEVWGVSECLVGDMSRVQEPQIDSLCVSQALACCEWLYPLFTCWELPSRPGLIYFLLALKPAGAVDSGVLSKLYALQSSKLQLEGILSKRYATYCKFTLSTLDIYLTPLKMHHSVVSKGRCQHDAPQCCVQGEMST